LSDGDDFGIEPPQLLPGAPGRLHPGEKVRDLLGRHARGVVHVFDEARRRVDQHEASRPFGAQGGEQPGDKPDADPADEGRLLHLDRVQRFAKLTVHT
jgi:hypothetical protein